VLKIGIVGHGYGADVLIPGFRFDPRVDVVAIAGRDAARASAAAEKVGIARTYGDWRQMLDRNVIDAIAIAMSPRAQREICHFALARGIHTFAEKPLASNLADARAMAQAAGLSSCANVVDFNFREIAAFRAAADLLRSGVIGGLGHVSVTWQVESYSNRARLSNWKADQEGGWRGGALQLRVPFAELLGGVRRPDHWPVRSACSRSERRAPERFLCVDGLLLRQWGGGQPRDERRGVPWFGPSMARTARSSSRMSRRITCGVFGFGSRSGRGTSTRLRYARQSLTTGRMAASCLSRASSVASLIGPKAAEE
jgi:hypothetical protein